MIARAVGAALLAVPLVGTVPPVDRPRPYLASIVALPLGRDGRVSAFAIATWGVEFVAICHVPPGWRITAGGSLTPNGDWRGEGSQGVTWVNRADPPAFRDLALIRLVAPVQRADIRDGTGVVPATFKGHATIESPDAENGKARPLTWRNVRLRPARACPLLPR